MMQIHFLRLVLAACFVVTAIASAIAQQPKSAAIEGAVSADEQQIRNAVVAFVEQYNAHNAEGVTALFATDARMTFRDGTEVNGHDEIKQSFEQAFAASP